ncbi:MAG: 3-oxoacyl-ACP reductase FabG [Gammaproteobacteria bacterium]|nr:3-oxoacyl-ACP reductase FabG [Gammaproteobacteria bacterium]
MTEARIALVTGASRGIGHAIAIALARSGLRVVGTATSDTGLATIRATLEAYGAHHVALPLNVADEASLSALYATIAEQNLLPAVLVNNAGITRDNLLIRMKDEEWTAVLETNLTAVYRLCKHFVRAMLKARFGRIINLTSVVGVSGNAGQANYAAAKAGLIGFTKSLAQEVASRNITVNAVAPGLIETDMTRALSDSQREQALARIPAGRFGATEEIAALVNFLASDGAAYITGETIHINGGMYMA